MALRVTNGYGSRLHRLTLRRRIRNALESVHTAFLIEIACAVGIGALLFIH